MRFGNIPCLPGSQPALVCLRKAALERACAVSREAEKLRFQGQHVALTIPCPSG